MLELILELLAELFDSAGDVAGDVAEGAGDFLAAAGAAAITGAAVGAGTVLAAAGVMYVYDYLSKKKLQQELPTIIAKSPDLMNTLSKKMQGAGQISITDLRMRVSDKTYNAREKKQIITVEVQNKHTGRAEQIKVAAEQVEGLEPGTVLY